MSRNNYNNDFWQWGKWKGTPLPEVPDDYLRWAAENMTYDKAVKAAAAELEYRNIPVPKPKPVSEDAKKASAAQYEMKKMAATIHEIAIGLNRLLSANNMPTINTEYKSPPKGFDSEAKNEMAHGVIRSRFEGQEELDDDTPF